jgi:hypothetical protein
LQAIDLTASAIFNPFCRALNRKEFTQEEIAMVSSLELGTSEEAKKLVPSLEVSRF